MDTGEIAEYVIKYKNYQTPFWRILLFGALCLFSTWLGEYDFVVAVVSATAFALTAVYMFAAIVAFVDTDTIKGLMEEKFRLYLSEGLTKREGMEFAFLITRTQQYWRFELSSVFLFGLIPFALFGLTPIAIGWSVVAGLSHLLQVCGMYRMHYHLIHVFNDHRGGA